MYVDAILPGLTAVDLVSMAAILLAGGVIKGAIGMGFPLVTVPLLAQFMTVPTAIAVILVPELAGNLYLASRGGHMRSAARRFWPLLVTLALGVTLAAQVLVTMPERMLAITLGCIIIGLAILMLPDPTRFARTINERIAAPVVGAVAGLIGGLSSFYGPPMALYFVSIGLAREHFIAAISLAFLVGMVPLYTSLAFHGILGTGELILSVLALAPVWAGVLLGQAARQRVPQSFFRAIVLTALVVMGAILIIRA